MIGFLKTLAFAMEKCLQCGKTLVCRAFLAALVVLGWEGEHLPTSASWPSTRLGSERVWHA